jgi:uncharacterized membrane protein
VAVAAGRVAVAHEARGDAMWWLSRKRFARHFDHDRVKGAIQEAERETSGQIVVSVSPYFLGSVQRAAERAFARLGVARTRHRNGVLFFVVPGRRQFVVLGDVAIHQKLGPEFWDGVTQKVSRRFRDGDMNDGLVDGIREVGRRLAEQFPRAGIADVNELSDEPDV